MTIEFRDHHMPEIYCPYCGALLDGAMGVGHGQAPSPDDFTVCLYCAGVCRYESDLSLVRVEIETIDDPALRFELTWARDITRDVLAKHTPE